LTEHFLERIRDRTPGREIAIGREAMVALWSYDWPGNVRELENMVERLAILCENSTIDMAMLPENLVAGARPATPPLKVKLNDGGVNLNDLVRELEGRLINDALKQTGGNKQAAARMLGLKRTTFSAKLRRCGVIAPASLDQSEEG
jgi:DNA-binding NtrC family response regulator